ncbi:MAG: glycosyltransferase family 39 protein, partial [Verrucomicrobiales bacterium]|nr:glycosyltransferase family 39 protein [Verrucomicrobiales bacterium]
MIEPSAGAIRPFEKAFWVLFTFGILIRLVAINQPLLDAHLVRQAQTADWTYHALQEPGFPLSAEVSWRGDTPARLVLEFPAFNYVVMLIAGVVPSLDAAGKLASILFWAASFAVLQNIWARLLTPRQTFWANLLFVLAPLSVFFGQAFMPEMCIQFLAFCMLTGLLLYRETGAVRHYALFAGAGLLGLVVKSLEITHLYAVALIVFWQREGAKLFLKPHHWIGGMITLAGLFLWVHYVDGVNRAFFPEWTATELSHQFLGTWQQRLNWHFYFKIAAYLAAFVAGPIGLIV